MDWQEGEWFLDCLRTKSESSVVSMAGTLSTPSRRRLWTAVAITGDCFGTMGVVERSQAMIGVGVQVPETAAATVGSSSRSMQSTMLKKSLVAARKAGDASSSSKSSGRSSSVSIESKGGRTGADFCGAS